VWTISFRWKVHCEIWNTCSQFYLNINSAGYFRNQRKQIPTNPSWYLWCVTTNTTSSVAAWAWRIDSGTHCCQLSHCLFTEPSPFIMPLITLVGLLTESKFEFSDEWTWNTCEGMHVPLSCSLIKHAIFLWQTACILQEINNLKVWTISETRMSYTVRDNEQQKDEMWDGRFQIALNIYHIHYLRIFIPYWRWFSVYYM
jgi:hypothetical protein